VIPTLARNAPAAYGARNVGGRCACFGIAVLALAAGCGAGGTASAPADGGAQHHTPLDGPPPPVDRGYGLWTPLPSEGEPALAGARAVWTGSEMIVWGHGALGARFDPAANAWRPLPSAGAPAPRHETALLWTGSEVVLWGGWIPRALAGGGFDAQVVADGARYDPAQGSWRSIAAQGAPAPRGLHGAIWTGKEVVVWGGTQGGFEPLGDGATYDLAVDRWTPMPVAGAPGPRSAHSAVWTGSEVIVWGGYGSDAALLQDGGRYDPRARTWRAISPDLRPRGGHFAAWTGSEMLVWGGYAGEPCGLDFCYSDSGARYSPPGDTWLPARRAGAPSGRRDFTAVWTSNELIVWGGFDANYELATGARYRPDLDTWEPVETRGAPAPRDSHVAVWTGSEMIVWGGYALADGYPRLPGGRYRP